MKLIDYKAVDIEVDKIGIDLGGVDRGIVHFLKYTDGIRRSLYLGRAYYRISGHGAIELFDQRVTVPASISGVALRVIQEAIRNAASMTKVDRKGIEMESRPRFIVNIDIPDEPWNNPYMLEASNAEEAVAVVLDY